MVRHALVLLVTIAALTPAVGQDSYPADGEWRQWGGPNRNFITDSTGLAQQWPDSGPPLLWSRPLGLGHSAIAVDDGLIYTLYRPGEVISRTGPWEDREIVIAMNAATGETVWEHEYPSQPLNFSNGAGPHSTPLIVGELLFTAGTNKQLFAFNKTSGEIVWYVDLVAEYDAPPTLIRPAVKAGFAQSPLAYKDTIIMQVGGEGQAVMALSQSDGSIVWSNGDFLVAQAAPILIDVGGQTQVVIFGGQTINGLNPDTGEIRWSHPHDTDADMNNSTPIWGSDNILFLSSAYNQGSRALRLTRDGDATEVEELWYSNRFKLMFGNAVRLGDHIYGTDGGFGPSFLAAIDVRTGETIWQQRGFGKSSLVYADGKAILVDEDGRLILVSLSPDGATVLAQTQAFDTVSWTAPTLVDTTLYARDRKKIVAYNLGD